MKVPKFSLIVFLLVSIYAYSGCNLSEKKENVVAEYGDQRQITFAELDKYANDWFYLRRLRDKKIAYETALHDMVKNQMKRVDFFERKLDTKEELVQKIFRQINEELIGVLFDKQYMAKYTSDDFAQKVYNQLDKRVVYQEIILTKPTNATKEELDEIGKKALSIKSEIENGADFNLMLHKYSENQESVRNNGYASPVAWKQSVYDPVGSVVFNLNKNDIRVLVTDQDYRIVKVVEITKVQLEPYEKIKDQVIADIKEVYTQKCLEEYNKDKDASIDTASIQWNETALEQLVKWSAIPNIFTDQYKDSLASLISSNNEVIMTYKGGKVDYNEFFRLINNVMVVNNEGKMDRTTVTSLIIDAVTTDKMIKKAEALGYSKGFLNAFTENPVLKDRLVYLYNQSEIEDKIPPLIEENLHKFFKENEGTIFYQLEKRNIYMMYFDNEQKANEESDKIKAGMEFGKNAKRLFVKTYIKGRDGSCKTLNGKEEPVFTDVAFKLKLSEVSDPVKFVDEDGSTKYAIIKCEQIRPEKQLTYEESKNTINEEFKKFYREKLESEIEKRLVEKYHPKYYYDVLSKMISLE